MMSFQGNGDPRVLNIPLGYVKEVRVRELSGGKTAGLAVGVTLGAAATVMLTALVVIVVSFGGSGGIE
jgi:hypothetical protein